MKLTAIKQDYKDVPKNQITFFEEILVYAGLNMFLIICYFLGS
tara:strand:+ start:29 stop:157 length:129 start_codon:yes stop_codon:yes gene_type:complete